MTEKERRDKQMDRYDSHMNRHGHYSEKKQKEILKNSPRSPILDAILRSGQKLASDYEKRVGPPPPLKAGEKTPKFASKSGATKTEQEYADELKLPED